MKKIFWLFMVMAMVAGVISCSDFIEPNISKKSVSVISPSEGFVSPTLSVNFTWAELKGARSYELSIVKGTFASPLQLITDTTITGKESFLASLVPGIYQWKIRAVNNGYESLPVVTTFQVDSTLQLENQTPYLIKPVNSVYQKSKTVTFGWQSIPNALEYRLEVYDITDSSAITKVVSVDPTLTEYTTTLPGTEDAKYAWRVQARNDISLSQFSTYSYFYVKVSVPSNSVPLNKDSAYLHQPLVLNWTKPTSAAIAGDSLILSSDSGFVGDLVKYYTTANSFTIDTVTLQSNYSSAQSIWWRLRTIDKAGNASTLNVATQRRKIKVRH